MTIARAWLPREALTDGTLSVGLTALAERWADDWFGGTRRSALARIESGSGQFASDATCWQSDEAGLSAALEPALDLTIARWMLNVSDAPPKLNIADTRLLHDLSCACVEDFLKRTCAFFQLTPLVSRAKPRRGREAGVRFSVSLGQTRVLTLSVDDHVAAAGRKALLGAAEEPALGRRSDAIAPATARIGVMLGTARIGLTELSTLAIGDVLVLDRGQRDQLPITINGHTRSAGGSLQQDGSRFRLRVTQLEQGGVQ